MKNVISMSFIYKIFIMVMVICAALFIQAKAQNNVVGYMPTYSNYPNAVYAADLDILTHIDIAFVNPDGNGNIYMPNGTSTVVNVAHAKNVKVLASICGGAGDANTYRTILSNTNTTNTFINNLVQMTISNNLDGIDVDIEGNVLDGNYVTAGQYESFVTKLAVALHAQNKLMTAALAGWFVNNVTNTAAQSFDFIGLMSYDAYGGWTGPGQHSPYSMAVSDFNTFRAKGVAANKLLIGLPFYGYGWGSNQRAWTFNEITNAFPGSENNDQVGSGANVIYYNGIPTIKQKCDFAKLNAGGVMIWELTQDATGTKSLLKAIGELIGTKSPNLVPTNLATNKPVTVSSTEVGANIAANLTDGLYATRWSSLYADPQWAYVDLQDVYNVQEVKLTWETAMARNYVVETSLDAQTWTNQKTITNNATLTNDHTGLSANARYVRIYGTARTTTFGYSIFEIEVYGKNLPKPYSGTAISVPGTIQAENYDLGGEGVAFHDINTGNNSPVLRTDKVMLEACTDAGAGYNLADIQAGEWTLYSINVSQTGTYDFSVRVAATDAGKTFHIEIDNVNVTGAIAIPNTGGWQNWQTVTIKNIVLTNGAKQMKVVMDAALFNLNYVQISAPVTTAIEDLTNEDGFNVYPNPSVGDFNFTLPVSMLGENKIELINTNGVVAYQTVNSPVDGIISGDDLTAGVYFFKVSNGSSVLVKRIVVMK